MRMMKVIEHNKTLFEEDLQNFASLNSIYITEKLLKGNWNLKFLKLFGYKSIHLVENDSEVYPDYLFKYVKQNNNENTNQNKLNIFKKYILHILIIIIAIIFCIFTKV